ncbi:MAG: hypothetical protein M1814_000481 [Vezdaea aestivalis]|nr:MAG: hypothetical protein M1814_000481 [Vezdaea aestivalis]
MERPLTLFPDDGELALGFDEPGMTTGQSQTERRFTRFPGAAPDSKGSLARIDKKASLIGRPAPRRRKVTEQKRLQAIKLCVGQDDGLLAQKPFYQVKNPAECFHSILKTHQGTIACRKNGTYEKVLINSTAARPSDHNVSLLGGLSQPNIVELLEVMSYESETFWIYEFMEYSLSEMSDCKLNLKESHVATISNEVIKGISYIHGTLGAEHGNINAGNILLSMKGAVKIGNVANAQFSDITAGPTKGDSKDLQDLGCILLGLMEDGSKHRGLPSQTPEDIWSPSLKAFVKSTAYASCLDLQNCSFLKQATDPRSLIPLLQVTSLMVGKVWSLLDEGLLRK